MKTQALEKPGLTFTWILDRKNRQKFIMGKSHDLIRRGKKILSKAKENIQTKKYCKYYQPLKRL
ncbi:MAG: hypothetical protein IPP86_18010 [Bacteroidetes bacterium]|nr:hypothetical protein [Bacteroidota bacterium]